MNINFTELTVKILDIKKTHPNLLASAIVTLKESEGGCLAISGFTIWISKHGGYNVEMPQKPGFKFCFCDKSLWDKIKQEILKEYGKFIPIVEDEATIVNNYSL